MNFSVLIYTILLSAIKYLDLHRHPTHNKNSGTLQILYSSNLHRRSFLTHEQSESNMGYPQVPLPGNRCLLRHYQLNHYLRKSSSDEPYTIFHAAQAHCKYLPVYSCPADSDTESMLF